MRNYVLSGCVAAFVGWTTAVAQLPLPFSNPQPMPRAMPGPSPAAWTTMSPPPASGAALSYAAYKFAAYDDPGAGIRQVAQGAGDQYLPLPAGPQQNPKPWTPPAPGPLGSKDWTPPKPGIAPDGKGWIPPPPIPDEKGWTPPAPQPDSKGWTPPPPSPDPKGWSPPPPSLAPDGWTPPAPKIEPKNWFPLPPTPEPNTPGVVPPGAEMLPPPGQGVVTPHPAPHLTPHIQPVAHGPVEPQEPYMVGYLEDTTPLFCNLLTPNPDARSFKYVMADFLLWRVKEQTVPGTFPIVLDDLPATTRESTVPDSVGIGNLPLVGGRLTIGRWLSTKVPMAIEGSGFFLAQRDDSADFVFKDQAVADPPLYTSILGENVSLASTARLWGAEINFRTECYRWCKGKYSGYIDVLCGLRYLELEESLQMRGEVAFAGGTLDNASIVTIDDFATHNRVFAGQLGAEATLKKGNWIFGIYGKIGAGGSRQVVDISGRTEVIFPTGTQFFTNGFLAQASNVGQFSRNQIVVIPEGGGSITYEFNKYVRLGGSFSFLTLTRVLRPGDEVTPFEVTTAPTYVYGTPAPTPAFEFRDATFWAQGLHVRLEITY